MFFKNRTNFDDCCCKQNWNTSSNNFDYSYNQNCCDDDNFNFTNNSTWQDFNGWQNSSNRDDYDGNRQNRDNCCCRNLCNNHHHNNRCCRNHTCNNREHNCNRHRTGYCFCGFFKNLDAGN